MSSAGIELRTGKKWRAENAVEVVESWLRQKALVGTLAAGRGGLGYFTTYSRKRSEKWWTKSEGTGWKALAVGSVD